VISEKFVTAFTAGSELMAENTQVKISIETPVTVKRRAGLQLMGA
jgi:hypothetical protein